MACGNRMNFRRGSYDSYAKRAPYGLHHLAMIHPRPLPDSRHDDRQHIAFPL